MNKTRTYLRNENNENLKAKGPCMRHVVRKMSNPTKKKYSHQVLSSIPCLPCESSKPPPFTNRLKNDLMYIFSESCYIRFCMHMSSNFL